MTHDPDPTRAMLEPGDRMAGDVPGGLDFVAEALRADRVKLGLPPIGKPTALRPCERCGGSGVEPGGEP